MTVIDGVRNEAEILSAGHGPVLPYSARTGEVTSMPAHEAPLAVIGDISYDNRDRVQLEIGDMLMLVTDGFYEWKSLSDELFGLPRLIECLKRHAGRSAQESVDALYREVQGFAPGADQQDDATVVVVKRC